MQEGCSMKGSEINLKFWFHCLLASSGRLRRSQRQWKQLASFKSLPFGIFRQALAFVKAVKLTSSPEITAFCHPQAGSALPKGSENNMNSRYHCLLASPGKFRPSDRQWKQLVFLISLPFSISGQFPTSQKAVILTCWIWFFENCKNIMI